MVNRNVQNISMIVEMKVVFSCLDIKIKASRQVCYLSGGSSCVLLELDKS